MASSLHINQSFADYLLCNVAGFLANFEDTVQFSALGQAKRMMKTGRLEEAVSILRRKANKSVDTAEYYYLLGLCYERLHAIEQAERSFYLALVIDHRHLGALNGLNRLYLDQGLNQKARYILSRLDHIRG